NEISKIFRIVTVFIIYNSSYCERSGSSRSKLFVRQALISSKSISSALSFRQTARYFCLSILRHISVILSIPSSKCRPHPVLLGQNSPLQIRQSFISQWLTSDLERNLFAEHCSSTSGSASHTSVNVLFRWEVGRCESRKQEKYLNGLRSRLRIRFPPYRMEKNLPPCFLSTS